MVWRPRPISSSSAVISFMSTMKRTLLFSPTIRQCAFYFTSPWTTCVTWDYRSFLHGIILMARCLLKCEVTSSLLPLRVFLSNPAALYTQKAAPCLHTHFPSPKPHPWALNGQLVHTHTQLSTVKRGLRSVSNTTY